MTRQLLENPELLQQLYHAKLFDPLLHPNAAADSLGIFIFLLQPGTSVPQPVAGRRQPRRGIGAAEWTTVHAIAFGDTT